MKRKETTVKIIPHAPPAALPITEHCGEQRGAKATKAWGRQAEWAGTLMKGSGRELEESAEWSNSPSNWTDYNYIICKMYRNGQIRSQTAKKKKKSPNQIVWKVKSTQCKRKWYFLMLKAKVHNEDRTCVNIYELRNSITVVLKQTLRQCKET